MTKNRAATPLQPHPRSRNAITFALSLLPLFAAIVAAGMMATRHIWSIGLPGCGAGGGCDWAIKSQWSTLLGMPVAFMGLGYFVATLVFWVSTSRRGVWPPMLLVIGVLIAVNVHPGVPNDAALKSLMMLGMFGGALILGATAVKAWADARLPRAPA